MKIDPDVAVASVLCGGGVILLERGGFKIFIYNCYDCIYLPVKYPLKLTLFYENF